MASRMAIKRLTIEYKSLSESPTPYIEARPTEDDILQWYFVITGPPDTPFVGGQFLGDLRFPANYPYSPPSIRMLTPSGRFEPGSRLCLNMSDFHPETWNPAWNVSTILTGLLSFMCGSEIATGAIQSTPAKQAEFAKRSVKWNLENEIFNKIFPDIVREIKESVPDYASVSTIEVVPPSASDLVKRIHSSYRKSAYEAAQNGAQAIQKERRASLSNKSSSAASGGDGGALPFNRSFIILGAVAVLLIAFTMLK